MFILRTVHKNRIHKVAFSLIAALLFCSTLTAQEFGVFGKVVDQNNRPISFANIIITKASDSTYVAGTSTDDLGNFSIIPLAKDNYSLSVSFIGFKTVTAVFLLDADKDFASIVLEESAESLEEVSIIAKKPTVTKKPDRLIFNVEGSALTQGSTLQLLKSTPGVIVTGGNISVKNSAATIFINNRRVQLTNNELLQLLESAPAEAIKSVEVITNPSANYDADSGNVINITMSKALISGYRGNVYGSYTQGVYPRYNFGTSHYLKNDKWNFSINYNYTENKINRDNHSVVNYLDEFNEIDQVWASDISRTTRSRTHNLNLNVDYAIDSLNTLSAVITGLYTPYFKYNIFNNTNITDPAGLFVSRFTADNLSRDDKFNIGTDLIYGHDFANGSKLLITGHYTKYDYSRDQKVFSEFFDMDNMFESDSEFNTIANQKTDIYNAKADFATTVGEDGSLDLGLKFSNVQTDSDITKIDIINGSPVIDPLNTDIYLYDEKVVAGYANYSRSWETWDLALGMRVEQTNIKGESRSLDQVNTQDYFEWFPNLSISHNVSDNTSIYANYKRSITRPDYTNLNPFTFFLNENTVVVGNPFLQPTFKDHFWMGTSFLKYFAVEAYYINYKGAINELPRQNNETNIIAYVPVNIDKTVDFGFDFYADFNMTDWWSVSFATSFYNITEETKFGEDFISLNQWSNYSYINNNAYLLEDQSLSISFNITYVGKNLQSLAIVDTRIFSDLSISKSIWDDRAVISASVEDLFNRQDELLRINYLNQSSSNYTNLDNRIFKIGFRYNFGNTTLNSNESESTTDERDRLTNRD